MNEIRAIEFDKHIKSMGKLERLRAKIQIIKLEIENCREITQGIGFHFVYGRELDIEELQGRHYTLNNLYRELDKHLTSDLPF
ncbi:hypothetical protein BN85307340 [Paracholeplasma brassicae]|uniref:Uncharacterized protein n=1 Tax=Acholeplasma brassicae TaxID=61635 RepID=U4KNB9_9MOLU|nr:hypothetical protein [Paracholeplasma brassicae]CCV65755.1 hypothetical protein BN85307340 [Paracholeplasma brassicae]